MSGTTLQADRVVSKIRSGDIGVNILGDDLFDRFLGTDLAVARGPQIYLRQSSANIFSESVHEGTHALDFLNRYGFGGTKSVWQWENRAWFYERQFQLSTGSPVDFPNFEDMMQHIQNSYRRGPFNPY